MQEMLKAVEVEVKVAEVVIVNRYFINLLASPV